MTIEHDRKAHQTTAKSKKIRFKKQSHTEAS